MVEDVSKVYQLLLEGELTSSKEEDTTMESQYYLPEPYRDDQVIILPRVTAEVAFTEKHRDPNSL